MDMGPLRALVLDLNTSILGVPVTVNPDATPIAARGVWVTPTTDDYPSGLSGIHRREPRRVLALNVVDVAPLAKNTLIDAAPVPGGTEQRWRVDGFDRIEADQVRYIVVPNS